MTGTTIDSHSEPAHLDGAGPEDAPSGKSIEIIIARQLADYLSTPVVIVDPAHVVVFYNEAAERLLGRRYEEEGEIPWMTWADAFSFTAADGSQIRSVEMPMARALRDRKVALGTFWMRGLDGINHHVEEVAIPLVGLGDRFLGVFAIFAQLPS